MEAGLHCSCDSGGLHVGCHRCGANGGCAVVVALHSSGACVQFSEEQLSDSVRLIRGRDSLTHMANMAIVCTLADPQRSHHYNTGSDEAMPAAFKIAGGRPAAAGPSRDAADRLKAREW